MKNIAGHVAEILEHEGLDRVLACGHDFGVVLLGRLANYHPDKLIALAFLSVPYIPPATPWDIEALKPVTEQILGYEKLGYMRFFARDDSWEIIEKHVRSSLSLPSHTFLEFVPSLVSQRGRRAALPSSPLSSAKID